LRTRIHRIIIILIETLFQKLTWILYSSY
jgi:hypothetical protein